MGENPTNNGEKADQNVQKKAKKLTKKQAVFVSNMIGGKTQTQSAIAAGSNESGAAKAAWRLMQVPAVKQAIEEDLAKARQRGLYDLETAMKDAERAYSVAEQTGNANAMVKAAELKSKLNGLLIERQHVKVETVDISGALEEASKRVELMREAKRVELLEENPLPESKDSRTYANILELSPSKSDETDQSE